MRRRVGRLGGDTERVLGVAAVIGHEFDVGLLERLAGHDPLDALEAAESAALVRSHEPGRYAFAHALIADALYDGLGATRLVRTHRGVAEALEEDPEADPGALARHWARAGSPEHRRRAAGHARRAGERALRQLAPDEAQRWFTEALWLLLEHPAEAAELCDVLIELGSAKRQAGDATFRHNLLKAARSAMRLNDHERLTRAVLANTIGPFGAAGRPDRSRMKELQQALDAVPEDWPERPLMTAVLARELYYGGDPARGSQLSLTALAAARRGPRRRLAAVMAMATAISPIAPLEGHEQLVGDLTRLAEELDDPELRFRAANAAFIFGMHSGEPAPLWGGLEVMRALDGELHQPVLHWTCLWAESAERWLAGDLAGAEQRTTEAELDALRHGRPQAQLITFGQLLSIRTEQDALADLRPRLEALAAANPALPVLQLARGFIDAETGRLERAAAFLEHLAAGDSGFVFPFDRTSAFNLARSADIALRVGDRTVADELYDRLLPYQSQFATAAGVSSRGSVQLSLGRLATFLGRLDRAGEHLADADTAHAHLHSAPLLRARTCLARAELKLARGNREGAAEALALARRLGRRHGSDAILREAAALDRLGARVGKP